MLINPFFLWMADSVETSRFSVSLFRFQKSIIFRSLTNHNLSRRTRTNPNLFHAIPPSHFGSREGWMRFSFQFPNGGWSRGCRECRSFRIPIATGEICHDDIIKKQRYLPSYCNYSYSHYYCRLELVDRNAASVNSMRHQEKDKW
jgi:hypothetical protein